MINKHIKASELFKFLVRIEYEENLFSGVIVNPSNESSYCYIFTVKHGFFGEEEDDKEYYYDTFYDKNKIDDPKIKIGYKIDPSSNISFDYLDYDKFFFLNAKELNIDLAIFVLDKKTEKNRGFLENIPVIKIMESDFYECSIVGYPKIFHGEIKYYRCVHITEKETKLLFDLESKEDTKSSYGTSEVSYIYGISGSGVFVKGNDDGIYLCGVEKCFTPPSSFTCINLKTIIDEINDFLCEQNRNFEKIKTSSYYLIDKLDIKPEYFEFSSQKIILEKLKNEYIEGLVNYLQNNKDNYKQFIDEYSRNSRELKKEKKDCDEILKKLADAYLYRGIICHEINNSTKMINFNMRKAERLNPEYTYSILVMKYLKDKSKLSKAQLSEIKNDIESKLESKESVSDSYKIASLEALIEINKINENFSQLENNYIEILSIFERLNDRKNLKENNIRQMIQYYIYLSEILIKNKNFESAEKYLSACVDIINKNNDLSEFESKANELFSDVLYQTGDYNKANDIYTKIYNNLNKTTDRKDDSFLMYKVEVLSRLMTINRENIYKVRRIYKKAKSILADLEYKDENSKKLELRMEKTWNIANSKIIDHSIDPNESFRNEMEQKLLNIEGTLKEIKSHNIDFLEKLSIIYNSFFKFFSKK